jgi:nucleoside-diphosphate-sugar epimerase
MASPRVLVIGASGFIGGWVCQELTSAGAARVRAGLRIPHRATRIIGNAAEIVRCDTTDKESIDLAMKDVEIVVNCVRSRAAASAEEVRQILECAARGGARKVIHLSSVAAYGNAAGRVDEDTAPVAPINPYGQDKLVAEGYCQSAASRSMCVVVVRPSLVYGPSGEEWTGRFIRGVVSGRLKQFGEMGRGDANLIFAGDLGKLVVHLAIADLPHFLLLNANGKDIPTFNSYFDLLSRALGRGELAEAGPAYLLRRDARRQIRRVGRALQRASNPVLSRLGRSGAVLSSRVSSIAAALQHDLGDEPLSVYSRKVHYAIDRCVGIGFKPPTCLEDGINASVKWARAVGLLHPQG